MLVPCDSHRATRDSYSVQIIAPGPIGETEGVARLIPPEIRNEAIRAIPMQRLGVLGE